MSAPRPAVESWALVDAILARPVVEPVAGQLAAFPDLEPAASAAVEQPALFDLGGAGAS